MLFFFIFRPILKGAEVKVLDRAGAFAIQVTQQEKVNQDDVPATSSVFQNLEMVMLYSLQSSCKYL